MATLNPRWMLAYCWKTIFMLVCFGCAEYFFILANHYLPIVNAETCRATTDTSLNCYFVVILAAPVFRQTRSIGFDTSMVFYTRGGTYGYRYGAAAATPCLVQRHWVSCARVVVLCAYPGLHPAFVQRSIDTRCCYLLLVHPGSSYKLMFVALLCCSFTLVAAMKADDVQGDF